jgi:Resolvase, N terminal domain
VLVLAIDDALAADTSFPARVEQVLVRPSTVERDVRLEFSDDIGDGANGMSTLSPPFWSLVALDLGVDTSTPSGEMMASVLATFAQFERRLIGERTKDAWPSNAPRVSGSGVRGRSARTL